jgi:hypothetical protein
VSLSKFLQLLLLLATFLIFIFSTQQQYNRIEKDIDLLQMDIRFIQSYGNLIALTYSLDEHERGELILEADQSTDQIR